MVCCCTSTPWRRDRAIQALAIFGVCVAMCTLDFAFDRSRARLEAPASSHISAGAAGGALLPTRARALSVVNPPHLSTQKNRATRKDLCVAVAVRWNAALVCRRTAGEDSPANLQRGA